MRAERKEYLRLYHHVWYRRVMVERRKQWLYDNGPCVGCGGSINLEVDHLDSSTKVSHCVWSWSKVRRDAELNKCVVRCKACHKIKTAVENRARFSRPPTHGTSSGYVHHGCRCTECKEFHRQYRRAYNQRTGR